MPLSIDSSFAHSPQLAAPDASTSRAVASSERQAFAGALSRVGQVAPGAARAGVAAQRTQLSTAQASSALRSAWEQNLGRPPSAKALSILVGQWAHETGRGQSMLNYNFGGIKGTGPSGMSTVYSTREGWGAGEVRIQDRFRAYTSAEEGAADYVSLLTRRYPEAIAAAERGDPRAFVQALKARGYFTGNEASYIKSVTSLAGEALAAAAEAGPGGAPGRVELAAGWSAPLGHARVSDGSGSQPLAHFDSSSFADEVSRAALLISALRIGQDDERPGEG